MPVLGLIGERFAAEQPLRGLTVAACLHVTAETAVLIRTLRAGGARVLLAASNPLSTQDDTAAALVQDEDGIGVFARAGVDRGTYYAHISERPGCRAPTWSSTTAATWSTRCTRSGPTCWPRCAAAASPPRPG